MIFYFLPKCFLKQLPKVFFLILTCLINISYAASDIGGENEFPVLYKGRIRPSEAYARLWLYEVYHSTKLKKEDIHRFNLPSSFPLDFLWSLETGGFTPFENAPLFWVGSYELKKNLGLQLSRNRFSYLELEPVLNSKIPNLMGNVFEQEKSTLLALLQPFKKLLFIHTNIEEDLKKRLKELQSLDTSPKETARILEREFPLIQRLQYASDLFKSLPSRYEKGAWLPLKALNVKSYQIDIGDLKEVSNFTLFSDEHFQRIRTSYKDLRNASFQKNQESFQKAKQELGKALYEGYRSLAGSIFQSAHGKQLNYPSLLQLKTEKLYVTISWIPLLILIYAIALCLSFTQTNSRGFSFAYLFFAIAVLFHTALLGARTYILERPPVSNMFETVLYVPWIATSAALLFSFFRARKEITSPSETAPKLPRIDDRKSIHISNINRLTIVNPRGFGAVSDGEVIPLRALNGQKSILMGACLVSIVLLTILEVTDLNQSMDQVQAVLDSQFWLLIHVLAVVGSYGLFILGAVLSHFYLIQYLKYKKETPSMKQLNSMILQTLYVGTALLIGGTILGGIWAAESWGRFWDWDPKESWAFISICLYLIWIHAYRFGKIGSFGLSIGAISGLLAISFTWYGVNYILGTGLHSYGFGSGDEFPYYFFVFAESAFIAFVLYFYRKQILIEKRRENR